jgi:hypothetical protein
MEVAARIEIREQGGCAKRVAAGQQTRAVQGEDRLAKAKQGRQVKKIDGADAHNCSFAHSQIHTHGCLEKTPGRHPSNRLTNQGEEVFMEARVLCQFRVERGGKQFALPGSDNASIREGGEDAGFPENGFDDRGTDEHRMIGR